MARALVPAASAFVPTFAAESERRPPTIRRQDNCAMKIDLAFGKQGLSVELPKVRAMPFSRRAPQTRFRMRVPR